MTPKRFERGGKGSGGGPMADLEDSWHRPGEAAWKTAIRSIELIGLPSDLNAKCPPECTIRIPDNQSRHVYRSRRGFLPPAAQIDVLQFGDALDSGDYFVALREPLRRRRSANRASTGAPRRTDAGSGEPTSETLSRVESRSPSKAPVPVNVSKPEVAGLAVEIPVLLVEKMNSKVAGVVVSCAAETVPIVTPLKDTEKGSALKLGCKPGWRCAESKVRSYVVPDNNVSD
jgi:hypothetical protein